MVKRRVTADDYIFLQPGKEYKTTVGLEQGYDVKANGGVQHQVPGMESAS